MDCKMLTNHHDDREPIIALANEATGSQDAGRVVISLVFLGFIEGGE